MSFVVIIENIPFQAYSEEDYRALLEVKKLLSQGRVDSCRQALHGLQLLMRHRQVPLVQKVDMMLAEAIRNGECSDI